MLRERFRRLSKVIVPERRSITEDLEITRGLIRETLPSITEETRGSISRTIGPSSRLIDPVPYRPNPRWITPGVPTSM